MSDSAADPVFARYLIAPVIIDGPVLPPGEAEFRIIGTIAAAEPGDACSCGLNPPPDWRVICATCGGEPEPLRFRVKDWAGPYLPQDVVFEHRVVLPHGDAPSEYGPTRDTYAEALWDVTENFLIKPGDGIEWFIEARVAHEWKRHGPESFVLPETGMEASAPSAEPQVTDRGFKHYEAIETDTGEEVRVYESSAAASPHLWLRVEGEAFLSGPPSDFAGVRFGVAPASCAAHLTLEQARAVRDALDAAIRGHYQLDGPPCERVRAAGTVAPHCTLTDGHEGGCKP